MAIVGLVPLTAVNCTYPLPPLAELAVLSTADEFPVAVRAASASIILPSSIAPETLYVTFS